LLPAASRENQRVRRIGPGQIAVFVVLLACVLVLGLGSTAALLGGVPLGDFRGVTLVAAAVVACRASRGTPPHPIARYAHARKPTMMMANAKISAPGGGSRRGVCESQRDRTVCI
jgi:hypothetical protein